MDDCQLDDGERIPGLKQVTKGILSGRIKTVYLATDCDSFIESKVLSFEKEGVLIKRCYTKKQLGQACKLDVESAVVGIITDS
jgi:ribosomal protein L7Ae-like RNA K-turn-binding protein